MTVIQITEQENERMDECLETIVEAGSKALHFLRKKKEEMEDGSMGERGGYGYGNRYRGGYYASRGYDGMGERGGNYGGGYGNREYDDMGGGYGDRWFAVGERGGYYGNRYDTMGERRGVPGTGPYSKYR